MTTAAERQQIARNAAILDTQVTAAQFLAWVTPQIEQEADYTEENNENRTVADYLSDVVTWLSRVQEGEHEADLADVMLAENRVATITNPPGGEGASYVVRYADGSAVVIGDAQDVYGDLAAALDDAAEVGTAYPEA